MISMEISEGSEDGDLRMGRHRCAILVNFWRSRTGMERWMVVVVVLGYLTILGLIISMACLGSEVNIQDDEISKLHHQLAQCEADLTTTVSPNSITTTLLSPHLH